MTRRGKNTDHGRAYSREYYQTHKETEKERKKNWDANHRDGINLRHRLYMAKKKTDVFNAYGNKCACCGETKKEFLTIDHVNGGGHAHRQKVGTQIWLHVVKEGFPKTYQLLCFNCNCAKGIFGSCPHNREDSNEKVNLTCFE
jgi:hypothetical protein